MDELEPVVEAIREGRCVAFLGAGVTAPIFGSWAQVLRGLAQELDRTADRGVGKRIDALLGSAPTSLDYEAAAQLLSDTAGEEAFDELVASYVTGRREAAGQRARELVQERVRLLQEIPFAGIVTLNFDGELTAESRDKRQLRRLLDGGEGRRRRGAGVWWWDEGYSAPAVALHGQVGASADGTGSSIVLARREYRRLLYGDTAYLQFLRTLFATRTILYLGFSFTDAYLNELRSEVLAARDQAEDDEPTAFAVVHGASEELATHMRRHEGVGVIPYALRDGRHDAFDELLRELHHRTSPEESLGRFLRGRRILWVDATPGNNEWGRRRIELATRRAGAEASVDAALTAAEAHAMIERGPVYDVIITHYGAGAEPAVALQLLEKVRPLPERPPVIVFSTPQDAATRRRQVIRSGATEYTYRWSDLFAELERLLG